MGLLRACKTWSTPVAQEERLPVPCCLCGGSRFAPSLSCEGFSYAKCSGCGLVQMNPQPAEQSVRGRYGEGYLAYELENEAAFLELQRLALADAGFPEIEREMMAAAAPQGPRVLDAGCATGALLEWLRGRGWQAAGAEISPSARHAREARGLDVRCMAVEECRFPGGFFDLALASHLIEHLNSPRAFAREIARILRPGGLFLATTPNISGFQARLFRGKWRAAIFDHLYLFSARALKAMLRAEGFEIEGVFTWGGLAAGTVPPALKRLADRAAKRLGAGDVMLVRARKPA